jgi:hypothetical protein
MSRIVHRDAYYVFRFQNILPDAIVMTLGMFFPDTSTFLSCESDVATPVGTKTFVSAVSVWRSDGKAGVAPLRYSRALR